MELESPLEKTQHKPTQKPKTTRNHRMQQPKKLNTDQRKNLEQQPKKHKQTNQKRKKPRTSTQKTLIDQPRKHKPTTENIPSETHQPRKNGKQTKRQTKP